jgi:hypothetical protein
LNGLSLSLLLLLALGGTLGGTSLLLDNSLLLPVESRIAARLLEHVSEVALSAVVTVEMHGHEGTGAALRGALFPEALDLAILVNTVVLEHRELHLLVLALDLLGLGVSLLLALLATTKELDVAAHSNKYYKIGNTRCVCPNYNLDARMT